MTSSDCERRPLRRAAAVALGCAVAGAASIFLPPGLGGVAIAFRAVGAIVAPALMVVVLVGLLRSAGTLRRRRAALLLVAAEVAVLAGAVAQLSWGVGFDEADAGRPQSPFAQAFLPLLVAGLVGGLVAAGALFDRVLQEVRPRGLRAGLALLLALVSVPSAGLALVQPTSAVAAALVLLVLALRSGRTAAPATAGAVAPTEARPAGPRPPAVLPLAVVTLVAGAVAAVFALGGSGWSALDGTAAMRAGLAAGAFAAIPLVAALHLLLRRHPRFRRSPAMPVLAAALAVEGLSQAVGAGLPGQEPLWFLAATLAGTAGALLLMPLLRIPPRPLSVAGLAAGLTLAAGLIGIVVAPLAAPVGAAVLLIALARRPRPLFIS